MIGRFARVLYLKDYANFIKDSFIAELTDIDRSLMLSIDADPIPMDQAVRQGESKLLAVETNISNWQRKQNQTITSRRQFLMIWSVSVRRAESSLTTLWREISE